MTSLKHIYLHDHTQSFDLIIIFDVYSTSYCINLLLALTNMPLLLQKKLSHCQVCMLVTLFGRFTCIAYICAQLLALLLVSYKLCCMLTCPLIIVGVLFLWGPTEDPSGGAKNARHEIARHGKCDTKMQRWKMREKGVCMESHNNVDDAEYIVWCFMHKTRHIVSINA